LLTALVSRPASSVKKRWVRTESAYSEKPSLPKLKTQW